MNGRGLFLREAFQKWFAQNITTLDQFGANAVVSEQITSTANPAQYAEIEFYHIKIITKATIWSTGDFDVEILYVDEKPIHIEHNYFKHYHVKTAEDIDLALREMLQIARKYSP